MAKTTKNVAVNNDVQDLNLSVLKKKRFRIDEDNNKILELNTSDLSIVNRLDETYPKLKKLEEKATELINTPDVNENSSDEDIEIGMSSLAKLLKEIDSEMRDCLDYIFDSNVSELCASSGSMYDPINGKLRYEHLVDILLALYEDNLKREASAIKARVKKHTSKYQR